MLDSDWLRPYNGLSLKRPVATMISNDIKKKKKEKKIVAFFAGGQSFGPFSTFLILLRHLAVKILKNKVHF